VLNLICFEVNNILWATGLAWVREVVRPLSMDPLPVSADYIRGMINVRGEVIPVFDGRALLVTSPTENDILDIRSRVLLFQTDEEIIGFGVDAVRGVVNINPDDAKAIASIDGIHKVFAGGVFSMDNTPVILLDAEKLIAFFRKNRRKS
jgi:purine-binding chemotaxis protein CheW